MGQLFKIDKFEREEEIGVAKKKISASDNSFSFEGPVVTQRVLPFDQDNNKVNEIIQHINPKRVKTLENNKIKDFTNDVKNYFCPNKLNITIFDMQYSTMPNDDTLRLIAQALHGASEKAVFLPAIQKSLVQSVPAGRKGPNWDDNKFSSYKNMLKVMFEEIKMHNGKEIVGMVPFFLPIKYQREIIDYYFAEGVRTFAIDANFSDLMNNEEDLCYTLSKIKKGVDGLEKTVVFAFNTGIGYYDPDEVVSDDFLSIFAYVDVLGSTFKVRHGGGNGPLKGRLFSSQKYSYDTMMEPELKLKFGRSANSQTIKTINRNAQSAETANVRPLVGEQKIKPYLATKSAVVKRESIKRLESIAYKIG